MIGSALILKRTPNLRALLVLLLCFYKQRLQILLALLFGTFPKFTFAGCLNRKAQNLPGAILPPFSAFTFYDLTDYSISSSGGIENGLEHPPLKLTRSHRGRNSFGIPEARSRR
jgi:hypothetical protein